MQIQYDLVLRRFVLRRFTFTTLVDSDRALPTCGASLSQIKRLFSNYCDSSSFPVYMFFFFILVQLFWVDCDFSTHDVHQKDRKQENIKTVDVTFYLDVFWTTAWAFFSKIKNDLIDTFFNYLCNFLHTYSLTLRWLMSYIYGAPILDVSRSHTTTQHSR